MTKQESLVLCGCQDQNLRFLRNALKVSIVPRNGNLHISGDRPAVDRTMAILKDLLALVREGKNIPEDYFSRQVAASNTRKAAGGGDIIHWARSKGQEGYLQAMRNHDVVCCFGPAGTGKTYLAVKAAVHYLRLEKVRRLVLCRPAVEAGEKLGFLPGDLYAKVNPYLRPLYDALNDVLDYDNVKRYMEREVMEVVPLAYMRGRTLNNAFIILDEGQNTTTAQMKMFLTRMGEGSKIVVTGDITQIDLPKEQRSGMIEAREILRDVPGLAWVQLTSRDIVRHPLVTKIVEAYDRYQDGPQ